MKNLRIVAAVFTILMISAVASAQIWESVRGNHNVVKKERKIQSFTGVKVSSGIDVYLSQGNDEKLVVEADENLHEYITTEVRNGVLNVYSEVNIRDAERKRIYVTMKEVNSVRTTSAGDVIGQTPIKTERLDLSASSAGNIDLEVNADEINLDISSSGDISLKGATRILDANLSSAGDLNANELEAKEAEISVSSAGDAEVNVLDKITARASSAGDITYSGNPKYVDAHSSSAGGIHRR
jgi:type 1 fimbria pilin